MAYNANAWLLGFACGEQGRAEKGCGRIYDYGEEIAKHNGVTVDALSPWFSALPSRENSSVGVTLAASKLRPASGINAEQGCCCS